MKKILAALIIVLASFTLAANSQRYYEISSREWKSVAWLCRYAGTVLPVSTGVVTEKELEDAISRAENVLGKGNRYVEETRELFRYGEKKLSGDASDYFAISLSSSLEGYFFSQPQENVYMAGEALPGDAERMLKKYRDLSPYFSIDAVFSLSDTAWGHLDYSLFPMEDLSRWEKGVTTNLASYFSDYFPFRCGLSVGGGGLSLIAARSGFEYGTGFTGNTAIGDNYVYQEIVRAGLFGKDMGVYLSLTNFDSSRDGGGDKIHSPYGFISPRFTGNKQIRHAATYDVVFLDRIRFTASLMNMLDIPSSFDIRFLNPFLVLHNMFNYSNSKINEANNFLSVEISASLGGGWSATVQASMDQLQGSNEEVEEGEWAEPDALAVLLNAAYSGAAADGRYTLYGEVVLTWPGIYINRMRYDDDGSGRVLLDEWKGGVSCWSQDWLAGYYRGDASDAAWSGYQYGPDAFVLSFGGEYVGKEWSVRASLFYMAHGEKGRGTDEKNYDFSGLDTRETMKRFLPTGIIEHTVAVRMEGQWKLNDYLRVDGGLAVRERLNVWNRKGENRSDCEAYLGVTASWGR